MRHSTHRTTPTPRTIAYAALGLLTLACDAPPTERSRFLVVSQEQQSSWVRNFNPLLAPGSARWPTTAGIYEPLLVFNTAKGEYVPWLATAYAWSDDNRVLRFTIRQGVTWSDGAPFTARDVVFTFALLAKHKALDLHSVWEFVLDVSAVGDDVVELHLRRPFVPGLYYVGQQPIVPEHVWKHVVDPVQFTNEDPVATGPFTVVKRFQNQVYELGRNPHYWQPGKPAVEGLRFPAYPTNDQANLALVSGAVDWAGNFVPDVQKVFVRRRPETNHYWFPLIASTVLLYPNTARPPLDDVRVRKALSLAIDRAHVARVAMYDYTRPSDATGLSDAYARWRNPDAVAAGSWVGFDAAAADRLLDEAGYPRSAGGGGPRARKDGAPLHLDLNVVTGWSDWVRAAQLVAEGLRRVGVDVALRAYDFNAFFEKLQRGQFDLSFGWAIDGPTPYDFYRGLMATETVRPLGEPAAENWNRFGDAEVDRLLRAFEITSDADEQRAIANRLQLLFVEHAPVIPLFPNVSWGEYSTARFTGFPSAREPYSKLTPNDMPECLLVLTELAPK
jgi:peptide/nickel transport system substrate-binding protein